MSDLHAFREALVALACDGPPLAARDRLVIVPTRAAAAHLVRSVERRRLASQDAVLLPDMVTARELVGRLAERLPPDRAVLSDAEREALLATSCRVAREAGCEPPFRVRPGLVSEMLRFYDRLRRHQKDVGAFERLALGRLEPGAEIDRGAERLVRQTRFLVSAFREFERQSRSFGDDEHTLRERLIADLSPRAVRHIVVAVADQTLDPRGLHAADWDLLARLPGLERLDVVVTDTTLAGSLHERMHHLLPGIEEVRPELPNTRSEPALMVAAEGSLVHTARDREEEVAGFARRAKQAARQGADLNRTALVIHQPLPYVYVAREVFRSAGIPCQMFDALPLAAEPYTAAVDLLFAAVSANFARVPSIALMRSPLFAFAGDRPVDASDVEALDRMLAESGYLGEIDGLERLLDSWRADASPRPALRHAIRAGDVLLDVARQLSALRSPATIAAHLGVVITFLRAHERLPRPDDPLRARQLRDRGAVLGTLRALRSAYGRFDTTLTGFDEVVPLVRRWIESHTFAPRTGDRGVHVVDADSARFGDFDTVQLAGLVDGEWPGRPRRNIFYSAEILKDLGWPSEADRRDAARARFSDLLRLPASTLIVSTFTLEADAIVSPSPLIDALDGAGLDSFEGPERPGRIFEYEALALEPASLESLQALPHEWAIHRQAVCGRDASRFQGATGPHRPRAFSLSALERYQDCPFKYFAAGALRLEEEPEDESALSPRARGRFTHEVLQRFFEAWDAQGIGRITPARMDAARVLFAGIAEPLLARLPDAEASLERARLFGSAISVGAVDVVLGLEASRPSEVVERWLEYRLEGEFSLGDREHPPIALRGVADRVDLLPNRRLRVIDYKTGHAPDVKRALQVPVYALCAKEELERRDGRPWTVDEASYVAFSGKRVHVPVVSPGAGDADETLAAARSRLVAAVEGIHGGEFPPRPHDVMMCRYCAFSTVCRKDYVEDA